MSVKGGVVDIQLMHVARLCLCSHTKLAWVPFGDGSHTLRPAGLYSPSKGKYYAVHAKNYSDFERILKFKHRLGADVKCCNFLVEKSDTKCLFLKVRYQGAVSLLILIAKTYNAACFDYRLHTIGVTLHLCAVRFRTA